MYPIIIAILLFLNGCASTSTLPKSIRNARNFTEIRDQVFAAKPSLEMFKQMGPLSANVKRNYRVNLSSNRSVITDFYKSNHREAAPLLIFSHGNKSFKEAHMNQAATAATWGFHVLVLQLPNTNHWLKNGELIYEVAKLVHVWPKILDTNIDTKKILLVGHSFGGSAISVAAGKGAPVAGLIYLDPALVSTKIVNYLKQIRAPSVLLGADPKVFKSKKRSQFFKNKPGNMMEVSFKDATHDDAQYPSRMELKAFGFDPFTSEENQKKFSAAIIATAFSFANFGNIDFAMAAMESDVKRGNIIQQKIKR